MKRLVLVDTNVALVANGKSAKAGYTCINTCIVELLKTRSKRRVVLDDHGFILREYIKHLSFSGQPGPGDAFFKWLWDNQGNPRYCLQVAITPTNRTGQDFAEFPNDIELNGFDRTDRKFVAAAAASGGHPHILNASDTDWWQYRDALKRHGIEIRFLCRELMEMER
jgi:hypothetical protein